MSVAMYILPIAYCRIDYAYAYVAFNFCRKDFEL